MNKGNLKASEKGWIRFWAAMQDTDMEDWDALVVAEVAGVFKAILQDALNTKDMEYFTRDIDRGFSKLRESKDD